MADALVALWNDAVPDPAYPITRGLWDAITTGDPMFEPGDLLVANGPRGPLGFVLTKLWRETYPGTEKFANQGWIALMAVAPQAWRQGFGRALLAGAHARLRGRGADRVALGGSFHHVMPGVPAEWEGARAFFQAMGYADGATVYDVFRAAPPTHPIQPPHEPTQGVRDPASLGGPRDVPGVTLRPYAPGEEAALEAFLQAEFPGRWPRDVAQALGAGLPVSDVFGAFRDGRPVGFAWLHPPGSTGALRWAGLTPGVAALGPIGVASTERGAGLGLAVLLGGLHALRDRGAGPTVIDWTDLLDFYARAGFTPWWRYVQARRSLP